LARLKRDSQLELKIALRALTRIKAYGGIICEACAYEEIEHPECRSSMSAWQAAVTALDQIGDIQSGKYDEQQLSKS